MKTHCYIPDDIFHFKSVKGLDNAIYIVYQSSNCLDNEINLYDESGNFRAGFDRTAFEALENHVHLTDKINNRNFKSLCQQGKLLGELMIAKLKYDFPDKHFYVYVTIRKGETMIIRFHQDWEGESPYYNDSEWENTESFQFYQFYA